MSDNLTAYAEAHIANKTVEVEIAERVALLLSERESLRNHSAGLYAARKQAIEAARTGIAADSARVAAIETELRSLLPTNPIPPMSIG